MGAGSDHWVAILPHLAASDCVFISCLEICCVNPNSNLRNDYDNDICQIDILVFITKVKHSYIYINIYILFIYIYMYILLIYIINILINIYIHTIYIYIVNIYC